MAGSSFPAAAVSSSPIKSIQRGYAASSGAITITSVDTGKSFVKSFSDGASGSVGITGTATGGLGPSGGAIVGSQNQAAYGASGGGGGFPSYSGTRTLSAGATNVTTRLFGVVLTNSTTLTADGPCYWEVIEYV
jgi:hypothetical protein